MAFEILAAAALLCLFGISSVRPDAVSWNYKPGGEIGPDEWYKNYPDCNGKMQSPIDIKTSQALYNPHMEFFDLSNYTTSTGFSMELVNAGGHTAEVVYSGTPVYISGGGLPDQYMLDQFHFHWGKEDVRGSEHALNGHHYPLEMHIVHHQHHLDNTSGAAMHPYGLAVIGFFFKIGEFNQKFDKLSSHIHSIRNPEENTTIPTFPLADLLPPLQNMTFYRYYGSLTTPPCYETVIWSISTELITISESQLDTFRSLFDEEHHQLVDDYRPIQPLNHRVVTTNDEYFRYTGDRSHGNKIGFSLVAALLTSMLAVILV